MAISKLPVSTLVNLTVGFLSSAASKAGFGIPLIVDTENVKSAGALVPIIKTYGSIAEMLADGYEAWNKATKIAQALMAQQPHPATFKVASVFTLSSAELTAVETTDAEWYALLATVRSSANIQTVATWNEATAAKRHMFFVETQDASAFTAGASILSILQSASRLRTCIVARKADPQTVKLTISQAFVAANSITLTLNATAIPATVFAVDSDTTLAALATAIALVAGVASATVTPVAAGTDNDREIVVVASDPLISLNFSAYAVAGGASQGTAAFSESDPGAGASDGALAGRLVGAPNGLGSIAAHGQFLRGGIDPDNLSTTEFNLVTTKGGNVYVQIGGKSMLQKGQIMGEVSAGVIGFVDTILGLDRLEAAIQDAVIGVLTPAQGKLPYNNQGIAAVVGAIASVAQRFVQDEILEPFEVKNSFSYPDISQVSAGDKSSRVLNGIVANFTATGAIQRVGSIVVNVAA